MKYLGVIAACCFSCLAYAGGTIGGGSGGLALKDMLELARTGYDLQSLPKAYLDADDFRRAHARLSVDDSLPVPVTTVDGEEVQVKKLAGSIVDLKVSKEILPKD